MKIGVDLGGSHIGVGLVDKDGKLITKKEIEIKKEDKKCIETYLIKNIVELINFVLKQTNSRKEDIELIGIAAPGLIEDGIINKSKNLNLTKFPIVHELNNFFSNKIILQNDCKCAALAEKKYGYLNDYSNCLFLNIGTGIGGAAFINGKIIETSLTTGFGMGHTIIKKDGKMCTCGNRGCFEAYASMGNLRKTIEEKLNISLNGREQLEILKDDKYKEILEPLIIEYIDYLSVGISNLINIFGPEAIILGGSIVYYKDLFLEKLIKNIKEKKYLYNNDFLPKVIMAKLKNDAGMIGATIEK